MRTGALANWASISFVNQSTFSRLRKYVPPASAVLGSGRSDPPLFPVPFSPTTPFSFVKTRFKELFPSIVTSISKISFISPSSL
jgi:hypothetical protein